MSPIKLEFSQDRKDNNTATLVLLFKHQECSGLHFTQHLKQKFSAAQQALSYPDIYPHSFVPTPCYSRNFSKRMKNATRHRPSSEHVSNTQMKCRPMSNLQTTEMHKHCNFCMSRKPGKRLVDFTHFKWGLSQVLDVVWGFSTLPDWQQNLWWVWHLRFQFSTFESTYKKTSNSKNKCSSSASRKYHMGYNWTC